LGGVGFLTTLEVGVGCFCQTPTPEVQLDHFLLNTPRLGIPVQFNLIYLFMSRHEVHSMNTHTVQNAG